MSEHAEQEAEQPETLAEQPTSAAHLIINVVPVDLDMPRRGVSGAPVISSDPAQVTVGVVTSASAEAGLEASTAVEKDTTYFHEVRQAVGRGAPSLLLGTSTRSLKRAVEELKRLEGSDVG